MGSLAIIGAGAIGGYVAAAAARSGHDVELCVRSPLRSLRVDDHGVTHRPAVRILHRPEEAGVADCVVLTTKAHDSAAAAAWFPHLCGPATVIAVLQNGVDHLERIQPLAPAATVVPALVHIAADRAGPGHVVHRVGRRIVLPTGPAADRVAGLLAGPLIEVERLVDFFTASWHKLLLNVAANPITALTGQRLGVFGLPEVRDLARGILREAVAVGRACGADLSDRDVTAVLETYLGMGADVGTSMLADRMAGRPIEYELITATVVRAGARHGVPVPLNTAMLALLRGSDLAARPRPPVRPAAPVATAMA